MRKSDEYFKVPWRQQAGSGGVVSAVMAIDNPQLTTDQDIDECDS